MFVDVALFVASDFVFPKVGVGLGHLEAVATFVSMPEATVDKDDSAVFAQYDVGMAGESGMVEAIAEATGKEILAHKYLGACSLALYCSHATVALLLCHLVHLAAKLRILIEISKCFRRIIWGEGSIGVEAASVGFVDYGVKEEKRFLFI